MSNAHNKRIKTNLEKYGKGSNFGNLESIQRMQRSVVKNKLNYSDSELDSMTLAEINSKYKEYIKSQSKIRQMKRISNSTGFDLQHIETLSVDAYEKLKRESYINALINKGRKTVMEFNLGDHTKMTPDELLKFSGYKKKINGKSKTPEYKRKRLITHLINFYGTAPELYEKYSDEEIKDLFRLYLNDSGRLKQMTENGRGGKWEKGFVVLPRLGLCIFVRSSYEKYFLYECDKNNLITNIEYNLQGIKYDFNDSPHWYFPDFIITFNNIRYMIEIKANWQLMEQKTIKKLEAAQRYCANNDILFKVLTENELFNKEKNIWQQL